MDAETVDETLEPLWDGDRTLIVVSSDLSHQHPCADSPPSLSARFNDGRFRVTTEAKLRPLACFGCSMVSRLISAFRVVRQPAEGGAPTNRGIKDCSIRQSNYATDRLCDSPHLRSSAKSADKKSEVDSS